MYYYISDSFSPSYNLATEEYLMKESSHDFFMLYRNNPSVIIGKHQDAHAEIDHVDVNNNSIKVYRRISGGGAVYHDLGNLNYSFITNAKEGCLVDFPKYIGVMLKVLNNLGIDARMDKRNAIYTGMFKISGTACHVWRNRALHHGTILFNCDIDKLNKSLKAGYVGYKAGMVASVRSVVSNVKYLLDEDVDIDEFIFSIISIIKKYTAFDGFYKLYSQEDMYIKSLEEEKYSQHYWNYEYHENRKKIII